MMVGNILFLSSFLFQNGSMYVRVCVTLDPEPVSPVAGEWDWKNVIVLGGQGGGRGRVGSKILMCLLDSLWQWSSFWYTGQTVVGESQNQDETTSVLEAPSCGTSGHLWSHLDTGLLCTVSCWRDGLTSGPVLPQCPWCQEWGPW